MKKQHISHIGKYRLECTCSSHPEQYDVFRKDTEVKVAYFRLRHGEFRVDCPDVGDETIYEISTKGDGEFEDEQERENIINEALFSVTKWLMTQER